jgi:hypothetical protein
LVRSDARTNSPWATELLHIRSSPVASPARQIESKALKLPARERARLAERLVSSLDDEVVAETDLRRRYH